MADNGKIKTLTPRIVIETKSFVELEKETRESAKNRWMNTLVYE
jgi:hypothetical protein